MSEGERWSGKVPDKGDDPYGSDRPRVDRIKTISSGVPRKKKKIETHGFRGSSPGGVGTVPGLNIVEGCVRGSDLSPVE